MEAQVLNQLLSKSNALILYARLISDKANVQLDLISMTI